MTDPRHIHVIGIGGSAMAPLAGMLRERGFRVTGSDSGVYPPASTLLESLGISFFHSAGQSGTGGSARSQNFLPLHAGNS